VRAEGNLQPWIAARCAGKDFGEALQGLSLPIDHRFTLLLTPGAKGPDVKTSIECAGVFSAWGVSGKSLQATTENIEGGMRVRAKLGLADGEALFTLDGDPLHETKVSLGLKGCDPAQIGQLLNDLSTAKPKDSPPPVAAKTATAGKLDLDFAGQLDLEKPRLLKGLGHYSLIDPELNEAVSGSRWIADHPGGGHQVELSVHPGWNHLLGPATEQLLRRLAPKGDQLWLLSDTDDGARQQWLAQLGAEEHGDVVLMARSLWRRQDSPAVRGAAQRISAVLEQLQPRLQPRRRSVPTPFVQA
jgi:hypothetical protein